MSKICHFDYSDDPQWNFTTLCGIQILGLKGYKNWGHMSINLCTNTLILLETKKSPFQFPFCQTCYKRFQELKPLLDIQRANLT